MLDVSPITSSKYTKNELELGCFFYSEAMRRLQPYLVFFALCLGLPAAEVVPLKHTKFLSNPNAGPGPVRLASANAVGAFVLSEPAAVGAPWTLHSPQGRSALAIPAATLVALGDTHVVWNRPSPLNATISFCALPLCENTNSTVADIRGIVAMKSLGSSVFAIHNEATGSYLSQIDLPSGRVTKLDTLAMDRQIFRFGHSTPSRVVVVDPGALRFRVVVPGNASAGTSWVDLRSDRIDAMKNRKSSFQAFGGAKVVSVGLFTHWLSPSGRDLFLLAEAEKGVGQYAIEVDRDGREQARYLLTWPAGKSENLGFPDYDRTFVSSEGVHLYSRRGAELVYGGVK